MSLGPLLDKLDSRVGIDKEEGDIAYFHALTLQLEYITKLVTAGVIACLDDDPDRHRYSLEHHLVRADSIGDWVDKLNHALTGPPAQHFLPEARNITRELTERIGVGDWRYEAVRCLHDVASEFGVAAQLGSKVALRQFFEIAVAIRNRTRGHGATTSAQCARVCPSLAGAIQRVIDQVHLFRLPWAYLHRNLSGKYRLSPLLGDSSPFDYLKRTRDVRLQDGVYIHVGRPVRVALVFSDPDLSDVFLPNGNFKSPAFEVLSYVTNDTRQENATAWLEPPGRLPPSETQGLTALEPMGKTFANLPPMPVGYIQRAALELQLRRELLTRERHPIISLTGPGGIGKTTVAIAAIRSIAELDPPAYEVIVWLSARDIDLLESGPKPVSPRVVRKQDIARAAVELLEPRERHESGFQPDAYFQGCLANGAVGPTLFVLDNFETLHSPGDVFAWIDAHIRPPNKVLITTRFRDFAGDYPIDIGGMTDDEALKLIDQEAKRLGISDLLEPTYKDELIVESDGHPYVIKILLGQVAKERRAVKPERIVASADHLLKALFERTYESLSPAAQRVFLLLCSWRVFVPALAVEAVSLRPGNERFDVAGAIAELRRFSLIEEVLSEAEGESFVGVPLAAASYGRQKLEVSQFKVAVEEDRKLLQEFGAGKREDAHRGVLPRIERLVRSVAIRASENPSAFEGFKPILEYLASRVPKVYLQLADLVVEIDGVAKGSEHAKRYLRCFLETARVDEKKEVWLKLADLCRSTNDAIGEVHALSEAAILPTISCEEISTIANRINNRIRDLKGRRVEEAGPQQLRLLVEQVAEAMERHLSKLSATDCSRLAWLYLNLGQPDRARAIARTGLARDPENDHCRNLVERLGD
jgi:hypothetical protein